MSRLVICCEPEDRGTDCWLWVVEMVKFEVVYVGSGARRQRCLQKESA